NPWAHPQIPRTAPLNVNSKRVSSPVLVGAERGPLSYESETKFVHWECLTDFRHARTCVGKRRCILWLFHEIANDVTHSTKLIGAQTARCHRRASQTHTPGHHRGVGIKRDGVLIGRNAR